MKESLKTLLSRIVAGNATIKDLNFFDKFIHYQQSNVNTPNQAAGDRIWASIENEIQSKAQVIDFRTWLKIAASVAIIISVGSAYYFNRLVDTESIFMTITAVNGQKKTVKLADGSVVKLNSGSSLSFPKNFKENKREVVLKGEAFFDVVRNENRPFQIITEDLTTTVLGTSFNIQSYPDDPSIIVTVASGKVQLQGTNGDGKSFEILTRGHQGVFEKQTASITKTTVSINEHLAWKENILLFENANLSNVTKMLERWYGVEIELNNANTNCLVEGSYKAEKLVNVLESLKFLGVLDYKFLDNKKIKIIAKPCKN